MPGGNAGVIISKKLRQAGHLEEGVYHGHVGIFFVLVKITFLDTHVTLLTSERHACSVSIPLLTVRGWLPDVQHCWCA